MVKYDIQCYFAVTGLVNIIVAIYLSSFFNFELAVLIRTPYQLVAVMRHYIVLARRRVEVERLLLFQNPSVTAHY